MKSSLFIKNSTWMVGATAVAQFLPLLVIPYVTRNSSLGDFTEWGLYTSIIAILSVLVCGRMDIAISAVNDDSDAKQALKLSLYIFFIFIIIFTIVSSIFPINTVFSTAEVGKEESWSIIIAISLLSLYISNISIAWLNRKENYHAIFVTRLFFGVSLSILLLISTLFDSLTLVFSVIIAYYLQVFLLLFLLRREIVVFIKCISSATINNKNDLLTRFLGFETGSALLNTLSSNLPLLFIAYYYVNDIAGYYTLSQRVMVLPIPLLAVSIGHVVRRAISKVDITLKQGSENYIISQVLLLSYGIIAVPLLFVALKGGDIFALLFGSEWRYSGEIASVMTIWILTSFIGSLLSNVLTSSKKSDKVFIFNIILFTSRTIVALVTMLYSLSIGYFMLIYSFVSAFIWLFLIYSVLQQSGKKGSFIVISGLNIIYMISFLAIADNSLF